MTKGQTVIERSFKGQNFYAPLRKGEGERTQMIDARVRCAVASMSPLDNGSLAPLRMIADAP